METNTLLEIQTLVDQGEKLTPMMEQYVSIKKKCPKDLLFFRMGDFYELFFDDAVKVSQLLNLTLTHRGKIGTTPIPMAGIPFHAAANYIDRLTQIGLKVGICEQMEDPSTAKGIVKRDLTQLASPGMPYDLDKVYAEENHFIASAFHHQENYFLVVLDFTSGIFKGFCLKSEAELVEELGRYAPREFLVYFGQWSEQSAVKKFLMDNDILTTTFSPDYFDLKFGNLYIEKLIPNYKRDPLLKEYQEIFCPVAALGYYINSTGVEEKLYHIRPFKLESVKGKFKISLPTLKGLEIIPRSRDQINESLLGFCDKTITSIGSRKLKSLFLNPLRDLAEIKRRQTIFQFFIDSPELLNSIRPILKEVRDLERIMAKLSTKKITSQDLLNLAQTILAYYKIIDLKFFDKLKAFEIISKKDTTLLLDLSNEISKTINEELGASLDKGNLIKKGANKKRDHLQSLNGNVELQLNKLEESYRKKTGITKLKIKSNNVFGHFIEVSKGQSEKMPKSFIRKQTLVNAERYTTPELEEFEKEILSAKDKLQLLERQIFNELINHVAGLNAEILRLAEVLATLDTFTGLSLVFYLEKFTRPELLNQKKIIDIKGAWHPLIKSVLKEKFVGHDLILNSQNYFGLITGPNMAGKTTVMREICIIQFLAQIGGFVPAESATLSLCDFLFSRLGASDDIMKGQSTFMVEMSETAEILRHSSENSLIILDEVGRGTSTFDGLGIAWSIMEHIVRKIKCLTLFATHYHELIEVAEKEKGAKNLTLETLVLPNKDVQFLYRLIEGHANESFGLYVAKLAGLPKNVLDRATILLETLEKNDFKNEKTQERQLSIFDQPEVLPFPSDSLAKELSALDLQNMTPLEAMNKLSELKNQYPIQ